MYIYIHAYAHIIHEEKDIPKVDDKMANTTRKKNSNPRTSRHPAAVRIKTCMYVCMYVCMFVSVF